MGLKGNRDFARLWAAEGISGFGSLITGTALRFAAILVLGATPLQLGLLEAADRGAQLIFGLAAGAWVDRLRKRPILIAADLGRAALLASIPAAATMGRLRIEQLYVVLFLCGVLTIFFDIAYRAYLPSLVRREELVEANGRLSATSSVAEVAGFGVAGWLVQLLTAPVAVLIDAATFLASAWFVGRIVAREPAPSAPHEREPVLREVVEGLRVTARDPVLRAIGAVVIIAGFSGGAYGAMVLLHMVKQIGFNPGVLGTVFAVGGVSSFIGALAAPRVTRALGIGPSMAAGLALMGLSQLLIPLAVGPTPLSAVLLIAQQLVGDGPWTIYQINQTSLRQSRVPERLLGRVDGSLRFVELAASLLGTLAGAAVGQLAGPRTALFAASAGTLLAACWLAASAAGRIGKLPDAAEPAMIG
jgi:hypothetical protein